LLDDTDLPVGEVALAAGYGSARQLHRSLREVFRATPTELRSRRRRTDRLAADGGLDLRVPTAQPFDWPALAAWLAGRAVPGVEALDEGGGGPRYRRTIEVEGDPGVVEVGPLLEPGQLRMRVHLPHWQGLIHLVQRARHLLGLTTDLGEARRQLGEDPLLGPLVRDRAGLRPPGCWDPFEVGVRAVAGQQIRVSAATAVMGRLARRLGRDVPGLAPMGLQTLFPDAATLAEGDLDGLGLTGTRVAAVRGLAAATADGRVVLDRSVPLEELVEGLMEIPGIGPWTAHYLALRLGEPDAFPAGDAGLRSSAARLLGTDRVSESELGRLAERWRPWRATAATHLWAALTDDPSGPHDRARPAGSIRTPG
jgi:AraC family transcriptional regulator of adaptative response / DNA-3-methyladenine glycosylase II